MSAFKDYRSYLIDLGYSVQDWKEEFRDALTDNDWIVLAEDDNNLAVRPPAGEDIGNDRGYGFLHVEFTTEKVIFHPRLWFNDERPAEWTFRSNYTASNSTHSSGNVGRVFMGDEVLYTNNHTTRNERTEAFYNLCIDAQTTYPTTWGRFNITLETEEDPWVIRFVLEDVSGPYFFFNNPHTSSVFGVASGNGSTTFNTIAANSKPCWYGSANEYPEVTIDLVSGFIYYLSVFDRSISLGTKTTSDYYGPISAVWAPRNVILPQTPNNLVPVELFVLDCSSMGGTGAIGFRFPAIASHGIGYVRVSGVDSVPYSPQLHVGSGGGGTATSTPIVLPSGRRDLEYQGVFIEGVRRGVTLQTTARAGGVASDFDTLLGDLYTIINVELFRGYSGNSTSSTNAIRLETPASFLEEIYMFTGEATNESLHLARIIDFVAEVSSTFSISDEVLLVDDTSLFPLSGTLIVGDEIIEYSGKTSTSFTGLTRARYGTSSSSEILSGENVYGTRWFVKINDAAMVAGTKKPGVEEE